MNPNSLELPERQAKPRSAGVTMVMDGGLPTRYFVDVVESFGDMIDVMKLGWGTSLVTKDLKSKVDALNAAGVDFYFGGTLFEKFLWQNRFEDWRRLVDSLGCRFVEVSNGSIPLSNEVKCEYVNALSEDFTVFSEVGYKDQAKSESMTTAHWLDYIRQDLDAGAHMVITESRESGKSGICRANGELRSDLIDEISRSGIDLGRVLFEAPTKDLQVQMIRQVGPQVNLGNISTSDIVALETLRLGLRGDTLLDFDPLDIGVLDFDALLGSQAEAALHAEVGNHA
ncbi:MAG: Phosphosulfolactate synthase [Pseudonocardiales bacterium]|nr:Phosphosulfolactate synthase [Pseudonocardiales bacterium]